MRVFMGVCSFCGDETMRNGHTHVPITQPWAHRNAQRDHTHREIRIMPSSGYPLVGRIHLIDLCDQIVTAAL
jgi:hypothetical protein